MDIQDFDISAFPSLKLIQPSSPELTEDDEAAPGKWYLEYYGAVNDATVIPISVKTTRTFDEGEGDDYVVLCRSYDGITGVGEPGGDCRSCDMAQWINNDVGRNTPPPCGEACVYLVWVVEAEMPAVIRFKTTSLAPAVKMSKLLKLRGMNTIALELGTRMNEGRGDGGEKYRWFVPVFKIAKGISIPSDSEMLGHIGAKAALPSGEEEA